MGTQEWQLLKNETKILFSFSFSLYVYFSNGYWVVRSQILINLFDPSCLSKTGITLGLGTLWTKITEILRCHEPGTLGSLCVGPSLHWNWAHWTLVAPLTVVIGIEFWPPAPFSSTTPVSILEDFNMYIRILPSCWTLRSSNSLQRTCPDPNLTVLSPYNLVITTPSSVWLKNFFQCSCLPSQAHWHHLFTTPTYPLLAFFSPQFKFHNQSVSALPCMSPQLHCPFLLALYSLCKTTTLVKFNPLPPLGLHLSTWTIILRLPDCVPNLFPCNSQSNFRKSFHPLKAFNESFIAHKV